MKKNLYLLYEEDKNGKPFTGYYYYTDSTNDSFMWEESKPGKRKSILLGPLNLEAEFPEEYEYRLIKAKYQRIGLLLAIPLLVLPGFLLIIFSKVYMFWIWMGTTAIYVFISTRLKEPKRKERQII